MAETLGSLVDKLSIKNLRIWHLDAKISTTGTSDSEVNELQAKRDLADRQRQDLLEEINSFLAAALQGRVKIRDEKLKLYNNPQASPTGMIQSLGPAISELSLRNIRLWNLEDEVRRTDLPDSALVQIKREIDAANQERNDLMDKVDRILAEEAAKRKEP